MSTTSTPEASTLPAPAPAAPRRNRHRLSAALHRHPRLRLVGLLAPILAWLGVFYLGSLVALFITSLWGQDPFTAEIVRVWTLDNFRYLIESEVYRTITLRTIGIAALVTVIDVLLALPIALYMAKVASPRVRRLMVVAVLTPLWASYLVKAYAWRIMFSSDGLVDSTAGLFGLGTPGYGLAATVVTLSYLWLPYMILPIYAGLERLPNSLLEASVDLGASTATTLRRVIIPTAFPAIIAGSIFTFSLSLGDYITVKIVGGANQMLGNVVYDNVGAANNLPFAAAVAVIPVLIMLAYLALARRAGALENV
ncbi:ABC transporter permease [Nocardioides sp. GY 10113]|uniref:ABC transporter permease n=1 Tax=Nocardioides sp. GY 10113 TaxID=2569761 RepID=UPI0010A9039D|nr:ABC transporter permease [Nocardioides sp. GY 10113]TIC87960.1 ABC transporter permease [Nocardioides sp. GY 10113]